MEEGSVEIQDEMQEVQEEVKEEAISQPTPEEVEEPEGGESDSEVSADDPAYKAGMEAMQAKMQEALNKRISKEVGRRKAIENQFSQVMGEFEEIKKSLHKEKPVPKLEDYETEQDFVSAMIEHKMGSQKPAQAQQPQKTPSALEMDFTTKEAEYAKTHPDYYNNLSNLNPFLSDDLKTAMKDFDG